MKNNNPQGIIYILLAMLVFSVQDSIMKYIFTFVSLYEVYLVRTLVSLAIILLFLKLKKKPIMTANHLLGPIFSFKKNFANIVIKKGVTKNKAVAVTKGNTVREI